MRIRDGVWADIAQLKASHRAHFYYIEREGEEERELFNARTIDRWLEEERRELWKLVTNMIAVQEEAAQ